jgi:hypothetical protein
MASSIRDSLQFGRGYPRPQLQRGAWTSLDRSSDFALDYDAAWSAPEAVPFSSTIKVPVIGNDGWESVATDIIGIHDYDTDPARMARRYRADEMLPRLFRRERPGGRLLVLEEQAAAGLPVVLSEFGGVAYSSDARSWGYTRCETQQKLAEHCERLLGTVRNLAVLCGFCYTQFADTYQEANGLLYADRTPKFPIERIAAATRGPDPNALIVNPLDAVGLLDEEK